MTKEQWEAIENRDSSYDGKFFYGKKSSKTICRPSCAIRRPTLENTVIFSTLEEGINAGYHPCPHCRPELSQWRGAKRELVARAESYIQEHYQEKFSLEQLAEELFVNKIYLAKCFKSVTGNTLLHYHNQVRCQEACKLLEGSEFTVEIVSDKVGFATSSHFAKVFRTLYGCSPTEYRRSYLNSLK